MSLIEHNKLACLTNCSWMIPFRLFITGKFEWSVSSVQSYQRNVRLLLSCTRTIARGKVCIANIILLISFWFRFDEFGTNLLFSVEFFFCLVPLSLFQISAVVWDACFFLWIFKTFMLLLELLQTLPHDFVFFFSLQHFPTQLYISACNQNIRAQYFILFHLLIWLVDGFFASYKISA